MRTGLEETRASPIAGTRAVIIAIACDEKARASIPQRRFVDPEAARRPVVPPSRVYRSVIGGTEVMLLRDAPQGRKIHGIASTSSILDADNIALISRGMKVDLPVPLLSKHEGLGQGAIGEVYHVEKSNDQVYIRARLFDTEAADFAWGLIDEGRRNACRSDMTRSACRASSTVSGSSIGGSWWRFRRADTV